MNKTTIAAITRMTPITVSFITDFNNKAAIIANKANNTIEIIEFRAFFIEIPPFKECG